MNRLVAMSLGLGLAVGCVDIELPAGEGARRICSAEMRTAFLHGASSGERPDLWIAFIDVGHGDATWIRTPGTVGVDAAEILIDAGDSGDPDSPTVPDGDASVLHLMARAGFGAGRPLDLLAITHPDKDHHGGAVEVLEAHPARVYLESGRSNTGVTWTWLQAAVDESGAERWLTSEHGLDGAGGWTTTAWGRDLTVRLLAADAEAHSDNDASLVFELVYRGRRVLLMGDAEDGLERRLEPDLQPADILRIGHHGGIDTTGPELLARALAPDAFAVISAGRRPGLPHPDVLARLADAVGDRLLRTDRGDEDRTRQEAPGDDHILARIAGADGTVEVCYLDRDLNPDRGNDVREGVASMIRRRIRILQRSRARVTVDTPDPRFYKRREAVDSLVAHRHTRGWGRAHGRRDSRLHRLRNHVRAAVRLSGAAHAGPGVLLLQPALPRRAPAERLAQGV